MYFALVEFNFCVHLIIKLVLSLRRLPVPSIGYLSLHAKCLKHSEKRIFLRPPVYVECKWLAGFVSRELYYLLFWVSPKSKPAGGRKKWSKKWKQYWRDTKTHRVNLRLKKSVRIPQQQFIAPKPGRVNMAVSISSLTDDLASLLTSDSTKENPINN